MWWGIVIIISLKTITKIMKPIIIAEDDEQTRKIFAEVIERSSKTKVDVVDNGRDLVSKVRGETTL